MPKIIKVKNNKASSDVWAGQTIEVEAEYTLTTTERDNWASNTKVLTDAATGDLGVSDGTTYFTTASDRINWLKGDVGQVLVTGQPPFADPLYRTKYSATADLVSVEAGATQIVDFQLTAERYVSGGCIIIENAAMGDFMTASVYDKDSVIPAPYRAALCENWPVIVQYVEKQWVEVISTGISLMHLDTRPLNAKITAGLYLRVTYTAADTGNTRRIGVNYYLTKKL